MLQSVTLRQWGVNKCNLLWCTHLVSCNPRWTQLTVLILTASSYLSILWWFQRLSFHFFKYNHLQWFNEKRVNAEPYVNLDTLLVNAFLKWLLSVNNDKQVELDILSCRIYPTAALHIPHSVWQIYTWHWASLMLTHAAIDPLILAIILHYLSSFKPWHWSSRLMNGFAFAPLRSFVISEDEEKMKGMMKRGMNSVINWDHATLQRPFPVRCCGLLQSISKPVSRRWFSF